MIVRSATAASFLVDFSNGRPDGNVTWTLRNPAGTSLATGTVTVPANAVSVFITIGDTYNTLASGVLSSYRDLAWTYTVGGGVTNGERRYTVEARVGFGASTDGVRRKLGIDNVVDLPDSEISLVKGYYNFSDAVTPLILSGAASDSLAVRDAIEAFAALELIPTMPVRIATKESSGTSQFQRQDIDWGAIGASLDQIVNAGILSLIPSFDPTLGFQPLFILASPASDAITGA